MTTEQKYAEVLKALGEAFADKNLTISCKEYRIKELEEKLAAAEAERDEAKRRLSELLMPCEYAGATQEGGAA